MKEVFNWMRGVMISKAFKVYDGTIAVDAHDVGRVINEAEAKLQSTEFEAMRKQIPMKRVGSRCGCCSKPVVSVDNFCPNCGQKQDRRDNEESNV